jgi:hypothetical protein
VRAGRNIKRLPNLQIFKIGRFGKFVTCYAKISLVIDPTLSQAASVWQKGAGQTSSQCALTLGGVCDLLWIIEAQTICRSRWLEGSNGSRKKKSPRV